MDTQKKYIKKLYEDAAVLHQIHAGHSVRRDRFQMYWEDLDLIE